MATLLPFSASYSASEALIYGYRRPSVSNSSRRPRKRSKSPAFSAENPHASIGVHARSLKFRRVFYGFDLQDHINWIRFIANQTGVNDDVFLLAPRQWFVVNLHAWYDELEQQKRAAEALREANRQAVVEACARISQVRAANITENATKMRELEEDLARVKAKARNDRSREKRQYFAFTITLLASLAIVGWWVGAWAVGESARRMGWDLRWGLKTSGDSYSGASWFGWTVGTLGGVCSAFVTLMPDPFKRKQRQAEWDRDGKVIAVQLYRLIRKDEADRHGRAFDEKDDETWMREYDLTMGIMDFMKDPAER